MGKTRVLFICTGNSARSQIAEAFLRKYGGDIFEVFSAGFEPKGINPYAIRVMDEIDVPLEGHRSKAIGEFLGKVHFGIVITVCDRAEERCPIFPGVTTRLHWSFEDPAAIDGTDDEKLAVFRKTRDEIRRRIVDWLAHYR